MGIRGAWNFLESKGISGDKLRSIEDIVRNHPQEKIHVDMVGTFYEVFEENFLRCTEYKMRKKHIGMRNVLRYLSVILPKTRSVLYVDGLPTVERTRAHIKRVERKLKTQKIMEKELNKYLIKKTKFRHRKLVDMSKKLFRITRDLEALFVTTARQEGWTVVVAEGEAEVAIGRTGGIVMSSDSDMLFYPKVKAVIRPIERNFYYYEKKDILDSLLISNEAFTVLGILSDNDYDADYFADEEFTPTIFDRDTYKYAFEDRYDEVLQNSTLNFADTYSSTEKIRTHMQEYLNSMSGKFGKTVDIESYRYSFRIFALQKEEVIMEKDEEGDSILRPQNYIDIIFGL
jgi:hypothetical protein